MGKASRRKRRERADGHRDRVRAAASAPAPNLGAAAVEAARYAIAMVTAAHASPEDLPGLIEDLAADRTRQGLVAYALLSGLVMESARELADARHITVTDALNSATASLPVFRQKRMKIGPRWAGRWVPPATTPKSWTPCTRPKRWPRTWTPISAINTLPPAI
jgi:hypothetical protein